MYVGLYIKSPCSRVTFGVKTKSIDLERILLLLLANDSGYGMRHRVLFEGIETMKQTLALRS